MGNSQCTSGASAAANEVEQLFEVAEAEFSYRVRTTKKFGWKKSLPDFRDRVLALPEAKKTGLPRSCDLRPKECFGIYNQLDLGSCTANAIGAAFHFEQIRQGIKDFVPCRLFIYYNERCMENTVDEDSGATMRDGIMCCNKLGVCMEEHWPYITDKFAEKPPTECYKEALKNKVIEYAQVPQTLEDMKGCICSGIPFVFGFAVYESFMSDHTAKTGIMCMPRHRDRAIGGHAICAVGYDDQKQCFIIRNSWGEDWGDCGYFYMPYKYICNPDLAGDFWCIRTVEGAAALPTRKI